MFNTKEEFILALMEGRKFKCKASTIHYDKTGTGSPFRLENSTLDGFFDKYNTVTEVFTNWYDDPSNIGKLCWFWNSTENNTILISTFSIYWQETNFYYNQKGIKFTNAKLLTSEELTVLGGIEQIKNT